MSTFFYFYAFSVLYLSYIGFTMYRNWKKENPDEKMNRSAGLGIALIFVPGLNTFVAILLFSGQIAGLIMKVLIKMGVMKSKEEEKGD